MCCCDKRDTKIKQLKRDDNRSSRKINIYVESSFSSLLYDDDDPVMMITAINFEENNKRLSALAFFFSLFNFSYHKFLLFFLPFLILFSCCFLPCFIPHQHLFFSTVLYKLPRHGRHKHRQRWYIVIMTIFRCQDQFISLVKGLLCVCRRSSYSGVNNIFIYFDMDDSVLELWVRKKRARSLLWNDVFPCDSTLNWRKTCFYALTLSQCKKKWDMSGKK